MAFILIDIHDLRPGMYIVQTGEKWLNHPYLYAKPGLVANDKEIEEIKKQGFREAYYDPDKSQPSAAKDTLADLHCPKVSVPPKILIQDEMSRLQKPYENFVGHMENVLDDARAARINIQSSDFVIQEIIQSIDRNRDALLCLSKLKNFDNYTYAHCVNVGILCISFATHLRLQNDDLQMLGLAGLFHDVGKMKIPQAILNAPRKLTDEEFAVIQRHSSLGAEIVAKAPGARQCIVEGILDHHERSNGSGYPNQKKGAEISAFGKLISLCDVYDALTTKRVYKKSFPPSQALSLMYNMRGDAWEREILEHFIEMVGIYPVGTPIALTGGFKGIVSQSNPQAPLYPTVMLCLDKSGKYLKKPERIDLAQQHDIQIIKAINPEIFPVDISALLMEGNIQPV